MVDTDDVQDYAGKYRTQRRLLKEADIDERDRKAIRDFIADQRADPDTKLGTTVGHLNRLRLTAEQADTPLVEMEKSNVNLFIAEVLQDDLDRAEGTIRNYRKSLRALFDHLGREWADEIKVGSPIRRTVDPDDCLSDDEVGAMLDAAQNPRDKALVAVLADTGVRIGAVLSFQIRHVDFDGPRATLTINPKAYTKDDEGAKPLTWSRGYVANWIDVHPRPDDPDAALFHKLKQWDESEEGALREGYAGRLIKKLAKRAGLDETRIKSRLFRSSAASDWIREGMNEQKIKYRMGWSKDSRMFEIYSRVTDEEMTDAIFDHYGIGESEERGRPDLDQCPQCRTPLRGRERFCPGCASPLTAVAQEATDQVDDGIFESFGGAEGVGKDLVAEARQRFKSDPQFRETVVMAHQLASHDSSS